MHWAAARALLLLRRGADLLLQWLEARAASSSSWSKLAGSCGASFQLGAGPILGQTLHAAKELTCSR